MEFLIFKIFAIVVILIITLSAGIYLFTGSQDKVKKNHQAMGESLACGIFLGMGMIHMLGESGVVFNQLHYHYPLAPFIATSVFLFFLLLEHIGQEQYKHHGGYSTYFAIIATSILCLHSLVAGLAFGLATSTSVMMLLLIAIIVHKWPESFALATQINCCELSEKYKYSLFSVFAIMAPLGIVIGSGISEIPGVPSLTIAVFNAVSAGTFIYLGTLHGLEHATLIKQCCNLRQYYFVIVGFLMMAGVSLLG